MTFPSFPSLSSIAPQRRQKYLLGAFLVLALLGGGILWHTYFRGEAVSLFQSKVPLPRVVPVDLELLDHPVFEELGVPPSEISVPTQGIRQNPFVLPGQ
ncbi:MAG TPA: hypothetical protein VGA53_03720 [Candidatus Paceibacterota bacterium]